MKRIREDLAVLEIPPMACVLPGYGWRPSEDEFIKINTDGDINSDAGMAGAGGVARSTTSFLGAWSKPHPGVTDHVIAEAESVRDGVVFARLRGFLHVIMETDHLEDVNLWKSSHNSFSIVAPILLDIGELAATFTSFDIIHVSRSANVHAHLCAKRAWTLMVTASWLEIVPSFLITSLLADDSRSALIE